MIELLLTGAAAYATYRAGRKLLQKALEIAQVRQSQRLEAARQQQSWENQEQQRRRAAVKLQQAARLMQLALLQLDQSPDFQRAATFAKLAKDVPAAFRIRQFRRFRQRMVEHLGARLRQGMSAEELLPGLTELVAALGVADYEADYIRREAEGRHRPAAAQPQLGYAGRVRQLQTEHEQRIGSLRALTGIEDELKEQLIESEQQRFRERMLALGEAEGGQTNP
jgi:hypothetical protein